MAVKNPLAMQETACNAGGVGLIPGWGRSPGEGNGNPLHILAWEIPWTEEPDGLQSMGLQRVDTIVQLTLDYIDLCRQSDVSAFYYAV